MVKPRSTVVRARNGNERGFTLIEMMVSIAILAIIAGAISAAFGVGLRVLAPGGPTDRLAGAHDLESLEQTLGRDGARAACIQVLGGTVYGQNSAVTPIPCSAGTGYGKVGACSTATLCFGWPVLGSQPDLSDSTCHVATYTTSGTAPKVIVKRTEYIVLLGAASPLSGTVPNPLTADTVDFQVPPQSGTIPAWTSAGGYQWVRSLPVVIKATQVANGQFSQSLALHPVASDPDGLASSITSKGSPC